MTTDLPLAEELTAVFARASRMLLTEETVAHALHLITDAAVAAIPGAMGAGVSLMKPSGQRLTAAASGTIVSQADSAQFELGEGPCLAAWASGQPVLVSDVASDQRWPAWSAAVASLGFGSVASSPLLTGTTAVGAVKVYARDLDHFADHAVRLLALFAEQASLFVLHAQAREAAAALSDQLQDALFQRDTISVAKGLLMARDNTGEDDAFRTLIAMSRRSGETLHETAAALIRFSASSGT
ncbi:GAF and ANTAR domain-containing protein [Arthrobacter sp. NicSoilB8]|uniref:GAF and ANTAR domain-containing protein n=1 Tax=Arthrobacter sp. NicSoilB8 TaxID=2830998 RepID=UPI001CC6F48D|nr:GAF and ANTAR domain-containing protein [Arthrobacter sp. NicSoilB8]BCW71515.1 transcriptional regulator [Arthrobacter sp. NicSoilB8]